MTHRKSILLALALLLAATAQANAQSFNYMVQSPRRAWFGFSFERVETRRPGETVLSLTVNSVVEDSPAQKAGLKQGDAILRINGLGASEELLSSIGSSLEPGDTVTFHVRRDGREQDIRIVAAKPPANQRFGSVTIVTPDSVNGLLRMFVDSMRMNLDTTLWRRLPRGDSAFEQMFVFTDSMFRGDTARIRLFRQGFPADSLRTRFFPRMQSDSVFFHSREGAQVFTARRSDRPGADIVLRGMVAGSRAIAGAELQELNPELARYFKAKDGVLVTNVPQGTPARRAGLIPGDVITAANGKAITGIPQLRAAIEGARGGTVKLEVLRDGSRKTIELPR